MFETQIPITYLPTGEIDATLTSSQNLASANTLLAPTIALIREAVGDPTFDVWPLFNWILVSYYWVFLYDFGLIAPTYYNYTSAALPNFTDPIYYSPRNNIFVNDTLFNIYSSYLFDTIVPFLRSSDPNLVVPEFLPVSQENSLQPISQSILRSYSCVERQMKGWVSATISVLVADYAFIVGAYNLILWGAGWWMKNKKQGGFLSSFLFSFLSVFLFLKLR